MNKVSRSLLRSYLRNARLLEKCSPPSSLVLQLTPIPSLESQRHIHYTVADMENAVLKALISGWPAELSAAKAKYLQTKRLLMRQDYVQLILHSFREGHGSSCLDFALENIKVVSDLFKLSKQTSITDTKGIVVQVTTIFSPRDNRMSSRELVDPKVGFVYYYRISIENYSKETVQLLGRHWRFKARGFDDMVVPRWAQGVIGEQPVISPGDGFSYMSSATIHNPLGGAMEGAFELLNCNSKKRFEVKVGETAMIPRSI